MKKTKMFLLLIAMLFAVAFTACGGGGGGGDGGGYNAIRAINRRLGQLNMGQWQYMGTVVNSIKEQRIKVKTQYKFSPLMGEGRVRVRNDRLPLPYSPPARRGESKTKGGNKNELL